jgi:hypothetical protein
VWLRAGGASRATRTASVGGESNAGETRQAPVPLEPVGQSVAIGVGDRRGGEAGREDEGEAREDEGPSFGT